MNQNDIQEGCVYANVAQPNYFRQVEMIVESPGRPGGYVVAWSTDTFLVQRCNGDAAGKTHGKCGIATFAKWATHRVDSSKQSV